MPRQAIDTSSVLVTRPTGASSDKLCAAIQAAGYRAYSQPLLELHGLPCLASAQRRILLDLDRYQHIIFISGNAVRFGMELVEDFWPQPPAGLHWYAVGAATADGLKRFGIEAITPGDVMSSEGLLAMASLQNVRGQRVLLVKGEGGRDTLRQELARRGAMVDELACYRRSLPKLAAGELAANLARWDIDVIMLSSGEGLANFQLLLSPAETSKFKAIGMIVPSARVATLAHEAGFDHVVTADNASDVAMVRALQQWRRGTGE